MTTPRVIWIGALLVVAAMAASTSGAVLFAEKFEDGLDKWTKKTAVIVDDPLRSGSSVSFTSLASGGDLFSAPIAVSKKKKYRLSFDYLGKRGSGGGIIGVSLKTPGHHRWLAGTADGKGAGEKNPLVSDGRWHRYNITFSPGDHTWFTFDGSAAVDPGAITRLRVMIEANHGTPGDTYFDNVSLRAHCTKDCGADDVEPVKVHVTFHANSLPTTPPSDAGDCPGATQPAKVIGQVIAQITPRGDHQGSGNVADHPHKSRCRVPSINFRVDRIRLRVIEPGKVLRAILNVHIDSEGVHRPGDCKVGTRGVITAIYDDTSRAANSLRNDSVSFAWRGCTAHTHEINNNISSVTADASGSTWVRASIACVAPGTGYSPRNCE